MNPTAAPTTRPTQPDPPKDRTSQTMPGSLAAVIQLVRILIDYGRRLGQTTADAAQAAHPRFATIAAVAGTHDLPVILARIQRGILRLLALETYLLERTKRGRELAFIERTRAPTAPAEDAAQPDALPTPADTTTPRKRRPIYDPNTIQIPTLEEMEKEVRRTAVGRTVARVCLDLAIVPAFCTSEVWNAIFETLRCCGGSLGVLYVVRGKREKSFRLERDTRPDTWDWDWRDLRKTTIRQVIGWLIGEQPALDPPECLATAA